MEGCPHKRHASQSSLRERERRKGMVWRTRLTSESLDAMVDHVFPQPLLDMCLSYVVSYEEQALAEMCKYRRRPQQQQASHDEDEDKQEHQPKVLAPPLAKCQLEHVPIDWAHVLHLLQKADAFQEMTSFGFYFLAVLHYGFKSLFPRRGSDRIEKAKRYCLRALHQQQQQQHQQQGVDDATTSVALTSTIAIDEDKKFVDKIRGLYLHIMGNETMDPWTDMLAKDGWQHMRDHPYVVADALCRSDHAVWESGSTVDSRAAFVDTSRALKAVEAVYLGNVHEAMINPLLQDAITIGDPHAQFALARLYYSFEESDDDDEEDKGDDEGGASWKQHYSDQGYSVLNMMRQPPYTEWHHQTTRSQSLRARERWMGKG